ncbi:MAG TPA: DEAD/DEAH box helicase [Limnochordia bacterium]|nr:DEAD/DEAH box helicase [Limnochordia bacterium]
MTTHSATRTYHGYVLDPFQQEAVDYIDANKSVLVAAPTGVGKTLIADYIIEKIYREGGRVVYTAPIKALSNQKFREFKGVVGEEAVGILTGDVVINPDAPILIMTTEIFRNMLHEDPERVRDVRYVIFDEIHYIDDPERGSVWEESLIFMPPTMRFLGLSATIPNVDQLASWIEEVQRQEVKVVTNNHRVVPLKHALFERSLGFTTMRALQKKYRRLAGQSPTGRPEVPATTHLDLISAIKDEYLPCLFFTFSRRKCESNAFELGEVEDFLDREQKRQVAQVMDEVLERYPSMESGRWPHLRRLLMKGIAYHHAGMLPVLKDIVEELFTRRLIAVLYCTETFAVGLNFPCKTVCFDSSTKWDGVTFRPISNREYFQMAGRAGRRGIDQEGFAFMLVDLNYFDPSQFPSMNEDEVEPLQSQFSLTYNSILNLVKNYSEEEIYRILGQNFATYQASAERQGVLVEMEMLEEELAPYIKNLRGREQLVKTVKKRLELERKLNTAYNKRTRSKLKREIRALTQRLDSAFYRAYPGRERASLRRENRRFRRKVKAYEQLLLKEQTLNPLERYIREFEDKKALLETLGYLEHDQLTSAGLFASQIHGHELMLTEMFMEGLFHTYPAAELNAAMVAVGYEPRKNELRIKHRLDFGPILRIYHNLLKLEQHMLGYSTVQFHDHVAALAYRWSNGESFTKLVEAASVDEGDLVFAFRRGIDLLRQVRNAAGEDPVLQEKLRECISLMDRDEVSIWL